MNIIDCVKVRDYIEDEVKRKVDYLKKNHKRLPSLCVIMVGDNPASESYVRNKRKACERVGIEFHLEKFEDGTPQDEIEAYIYNANWNYSGIMVQLPLPDGYDKDELLAHINPALDVDGLTDANKMKLYADKPAYVPCTARGVLELIDYYSKYSNNKHNYNGERVCIIGRSDLVGKPLAHELQKRNATVTLCHSHTNDLFDNAMFWSTENADIVISAVGNLHLFDDAMSLKPYAYIDCGYSFVDGKPHGDIDLEKLDSMGYDGFVTPTPKGTGLLTVSALLQNVVESQYRKME